MDHHRDSSPPACAAGELAIRAASSRLLGADPDLVLHGGGNTSLKAPWRSPRGTNAEALYVKGSGSDLAAVTERDFTPLALASLRALLDGPPLDNEALIQALEPLKLDPAAPRPSIETLLHASLPHRYVDHTHADAVLALVDTANGERIAREVYGPLAPLVPFRHSGFELALACRTVYEKEGGPDAIGLILHRHGAVSFGPDAARARGNMLRLADMARAYIEAHGSWTLPLGTPPERTRDTGLVLARLRAALCAEAGFPLVLAVDRSPEAIGFATRPDAEALSAAGPATPQHAVFTKGRALCDGNVAGWSRAYRARLAAHQPPGWPAARLPDAAPRIVVDRRFGVAAASVDPVHAAMACEIFRHGFAIASRAASHDRYLSIDAADALLAELHYGGFERAIRERAHRVAPLTGAVVVLEAPARAAAQPLAHLGAAIVLAEGAGHSALEAAMLEACWRHGGADGLVAAASSASGFADGVLSSSPLPAAWFLTSPGGDAGGGDGVPRLSVQGMDPHALAEAVSQRLATVRREEAAA